MARFPILNRGRCADLRALIRHLATCREEQRYSKTLDSNIPNLASPSAQIAAEHPDLFRVGGEKGDVAVSLLVRFILPGRPTLNEEQITALTTAVDRCHTQALEQDRHRLEWWRWVTSFLSGGVVGAIILELVRYFLARS
jgi:hypothetical protein